MMIHVEMGGGKILGSDRKNKTGIPNLSSLIIVRSSRRSKLSSGGQGPPAPIKDLYEQLFWSGFDPDDSDEVGDKTVFGGTKGKFNGLSYLLSAEEGKAQNRNRLPASKRNYEKSYDDYDDDDEEDMDSDGRKKQWAPPRVKPPNDLVYPKSDSNDRLSRRERKQRPGRRGGRDDDSGVSLGNWASGQVSSWFNDDEDDDDDDKYDDYDSGRGRRRQNRRQNTEWSPFNVLDAFFGLDRKDMKSKAEIYDEKMGLRQSKRRRERQTLSRDMPRRAGYAYPYKEEEGDDGESPLVADIDTTAEVIATDSAASKNNKNAANVQDTERKSRSRESSWEERALAVERVPPADIPAWGPTGELPVDARAKAIMDALDDIQVAKRKVEAKKKKEDLAREDVTILKV
jgi:hypothetical protein